MAVFIPGCESALSVLRLPMATGLAAGPASHTTSSKGPTANASPTHKGMSTSVVVDVLSVSALNNDVTLGGWSPESTPTRSGTTKTNPLLLGGVTTSTSKGAGKGNKNDANTPAALRRKSQPKQQNNSPMPVFGSAEASLNNQSFTHSLSARTNGGDYELSLARTVRNMTEGEREALLKEEAELEAKRARERIRKYKVETQALMDSDQVLANFESQQMKRYINRVKQLHSTRNRLRDLDRDFHRKEAMRGAEFKKKREAVYAGPLPDTRAVTPNRVWANINKSLVSEQDKLLSAETHQHTVNVATPILQFLSGHYRHPVAVKICERALQAVDDGSIDERARGKVPYSELPGLWRSRGGDKDETDEGTLSALTPTTTSASSAMKSALAKHRSTVAGGGAKNGAGRSNPVGGAMPVLQTTDPSGHQTSKIATMLTTTRNYPKSSSQRLFADELFTLAGPTDLLCDDVVSVLVYTAMFFSITRDEVTLMMQDKARSLVMDHVKPLKKAIGVSV